jgi:hypothetical protein
MSKKHDTLTQDMFFDIPRPVTGNGSLSCRKQIAATMSEALIGLDRYEVAAEMSKLLGRDISKSMLDAYTAESRENHTPPFDTAIAFDMVTGKGFLLANLYASKLGAKVLIGREALDAEIGRLQREKEENTRHLNALKQLQRGYSK